MRNTDKAFTLIELMVVVIIIGILAAIGLPAYREYVAKAKIAEVYSTFDAIGKAQISYYYDHQAFVTADSNPLLGLESGWHASNDGESWALIGNPIPTGQQLFFMYATVAGTGDQGRYDSGGNFPITNSLVISTNGVDQIASEFCGGSIPGSLEAITPESLGISDPGSGTYEWVVLSANGNPRSSGCMALFSTIQVIPGAAANDGQPSRSPIVQFDFNN